MTAVLGLGRARHGGLAGQCSTGNPFSFQLLRSTAAIIWLGLAATVLLSACDSDSRTAGQKLAEVLNDPRSQPAPVSSLERLLGFDAGELEARIDPPAPAGDLKTEIEQFTTVDACVETRAKLDPLLGDALESIGYDTFLRDACRLIDAAKAQDANRCATIDASALEARCRATVAEVVSSPEACPWEAPSGPLHVREPRCVAIASRSVGLCNAVPDALDRATCKATLIHDDGPCVAVRSRAERARCSRDALRWRRLLVSEAAKPSDAPAEDEPPMVTGNLHIESADGADKTPPIDVDLGPDLARGVTLLDLRDGARLTLGELTASGPGFIAPSPHVRASLALELFVPRAPPSAHAESAVARIERAELLVPGRPPASIPGGTSTLVAKVGKLAHRRGGAVAVVVDGDIASGIWRWRVHAEATTFVRDIVTASDLYGEGRRGGDAGMR
jgi:hypothetical protein